MQKSIFKQDKLFYEKHYMNSLKYILTVICSLIIHNIMILIIQSSKFTYSTQVYVFILILKIGKNYCRNCCLYELMSSQAPFAMTSPLRIWPMLWCHIGGFRMSHFFQNRSYETRLTIIFTIFVRSIQFQHSIRKLKP